MNSHSLEWFAGRCLWMIAGIGVVAGALPRLFHEWENNPDCGHVWLVLAVLVFLVGRDLREYARSPADTSRRTSSGNAWFYLACVVATALFWVDWRLRDSFFLAQALWWASLGLAGGLMPAELFGRIRFHFVLALFLIPFPRILTTQYLHLTLQETAASSTAGLLAIWDIPARSIGTVIAVGPSGLNVDEVCSGLRFMTILVFMSLVVGRLLARRAVAVRLALAVSAVPVAIAVNCLRLWIAGYLLYRYDMHMADRFLHGWSVLIVYAAGVAAFSGLTLALQRVRMLGDEEEAP